MLVGPGVIDIVHHFVSRWNFIRQLKYVEKDRSSNKRGRYPILPMDRITGYGDPFKARGSMRVQAVRSCGKWSQGIETEVRGFSLG